MRSLNASLHLFNGLMLMSAQYVNLGLFVYSWTLFHHFSTYFIFAKPRPRQDSPPHCQTKGQSHAQEIYEQEHGTRSLARPVLLKYSRPQCCFDKGARSFPLNYWLVVLLRKLYSLVFFFYKGGFISLARSRQRPRDGSKFKASCNRITGCYSVETVDWPVLSCF